MTLLILAALIWLGIHIGIAGTRLRHALVDRIGEMPFRGVFSLLSILAIVFMVWAWSAAWTTPLWYAPQWLRWVLVAAMLVAFVLFVASLTQRNPTMISGEAAMAQPPRGIQRVTRHPDAVVVRAVGGGAHHRQRRQRGDRVLRHVPGDVARGHALDRCQAGAARSGNVADACRCHVDRAVRRDRGGAQPVRAGRDRLAHAADRVVAWAIVLHLHPWLFGVAPVAM